MSLTFIVTSLVVILLPGTGALLTITAGISHGRRVSAVTALGCTLGIVPHLIAAITGTAELLRASGIAFEALKIVGVIYLLYIAIMTWRDKSEIQLISPSNAKSSVKTISSAVLANLLNPKLTIFFFAFLPQFVAKGHKNALLSMLELSATFMAMTFVVFVIYGFAASALREKVVKQPTTIRHIRRLFSISFLGLGAKLASETR